MSEDGFGCLFTWFMIYAVMGLVGWAVKLLILDHLHTILMFLLMVLIWTLISVVGAAIVAVLGYILYRTAREYYADVQLKRAQTAATGRQTRAAEERYAKRLERLKRASARHDAELATWRKLIEGDRGDA